METRLAKAISYLFHPLLVPVYIMLFLLNLNAHFSLVLPFTSKVMLVGITALTTILFPLLIIFLLYKRNLVHSFYLESREERIYPLLVIAVFYYLTYYLLKGLHISPVFSFYMLGATFLAVISLIITFYHKISLHMVGVGGLAGLITGLTLNFAVDLAYFIVLAILVSGFVGFARLKINSHKPSEIYSGFLAGASVMFLLFFLL
jgi:hypothetical protein